VSARESDVLGVHGGCGNHLNGVGLELIKGKRSKLRGGRGTSRGIGWYEGPPGGLKKESRGPTPLNYPRLKYKKNPATRQRGDVQR